MARALGFVRYSGVFTLDTNGAAGDCLTRTINGRAGQPEIGGAGIRKFILVTNTFLAILWLVLIVVSRMPGQDYATEGLHGIMIFVVLPCVAIGIWGRWLPVGVGLTSISLFMFMTFLIFAVAY